MMPYFTPVISGMMYSGSFDLGNAAIGNATIVCFDEPSMIVLDGYPIAVNR